MQDNIFILPTRQAPAQPGLAGESMIVFSGNKPSIRQAPAQPGLAAPNNLPAQLTPFIGREAEVADAGPLLVDLLLACPELNILVTYPAGLTEREVEVLRLVARGLTSAQIAEQLIISLHTVNAHMRSIFNKLDVNSRNAVTRFAIEHKLI